MPYTKVTRNNIFGDRFRKNIQWTPTCWIWTGNRLVTGYGQFRLTPHLKTHKVLAHRMSWEIHNGPIPVGMFICHKCNNPPCVNPDHLYAGTQKDNMQDRIVSGRYGSQPKGSNHHATSLTEADIPVIRKRRANGERAMDIAADFHVAPSVVSGICRGVRWKHV